MSMKTQVFLANFSFGGDAKLESEPKAHELSHLSPLWLSTIRARNRLRVLPGSATVCGPRGYDPGLPSSSGRSATTEGKSTADRHDAMPQVLSAHAKDWAVLSLL